MKISLVLLVAFAAACFAAQCYDLEFDTANDLPGPELISNGGFEGYGPLPWRSSDEEGFFVVDYVPGACGTHAAAISIHPSRGNCARPNSGIYQQVILNQSAAKRVFVSGYGNGIDMQGDPDVNFSLYVDVFFTDGTTRYGLYAPFQINAGFNRVNVTVDEPKPIAYIFVNLVFRARTGVAYFDFVSVKEEVLRTYTPGVNILADPSFEDCATIGKNWQQVGGAPCQVQTCGNTYVKEGEGSLSLGPNTTNNCFVSITQRVYFSPPFTGSLTFSAYVYIDYTLNANSFNFVYISLDDGQFNIQISNNIPFEPTNGWVRAEVTLTATDLRALNANFIMQGKAQGIAWDDASLVVDA